MRRDDDVEIPSLTLDQDEVSERRPSATPKKGQFTPTPARPAHAPAVVHQKPSLAGIYFLLLLLMSAAGAAGFWLWQQNVQLRNEVYGAKSEIQNLDHQLLAADVSANKQGETVEETLKKHDSEIRKLWGVSYDTNRKAIASNGTDITALERKMSTMRDTISTQSKRIAVQAEAFNEVEAGFNKLVPAVATLGETVKVVTTTQVSQAQQIASSEQLITAQMGQNQAQALSLEQILQDLSVLKERVVAAESQIAVVSATASSTASAADVANVKQALARHQDAIESIDAFRTQVNSEIIRLGKQINQLMLEQQFNAQ